MKYTLTHSTYHFAAATISQAADGGYFKYLFYINSTSGITADYDGLNGGRSFWEDKVSWLDRAPGFNLEKVTTPVRLEDVTPLGAWEWFSGLTRLGKPVELILMPGADHVLVKPWDRMISQQGDVDWFCFWLKGEEDPDPAKVEQYVRWGELRKLNYTLQSKLKEQSRP